MTWARPEWLVLLWMLPLLVILRLLVGRRDRRLVATLPLWRKVAAGPSRRRRRRWLPPLEVIGEVVVAGTMILALAKPVLREASRPPALLVVVDRGGSMEAPKRRAEWRRILEDLAAAARAEGRDIAIRPAPDAGEQTRRRAGRADLVRMLAPRRPHTPRVLVTDRRLPLTLPGTVGLRGVRALLDNVGIVAAWAEPTETGTRLHVILAASRGGASRRPRVRVTWNGGARVLGPLAPDEVVHEFELPQGIATSEVVRLDLLKDGEGRWSDDVPGDDTARLSKEDRRLLFLVQPGADAFAHALEALGETVSIGREPIRPESTYTVGRGRPPGVEGALLLPPAKGGVGRLGEVVSDTVGPLVFEGEGPASLPLARLKIPTQAREVSGPGTPLVRLGGKTLAMAFPARNEVVLGFDPVDAAWDAEPVFPLILRAWLGRAEGSPSGLRSFASAEPAATRADPPAWKDRPWRLAEDSEDRLDAGSGRPLDRWVFALATLLLAVFGAILLRSKTL